MHMRLFRKKTKNKICIFNFFYKKVLLWPFPHVALLREVHHVVVPREHLQKQHFNKIIYIFIFYLFIHCNSEMKLPSLQELRFLWGSFASPGWGTCAKWKKV